MKHKIQAIIYILLLFLAFSLRLTSATYSSATSSETVNIPSNGMIKYPILRIHGKQIVDENGGQVLLRGFNLWDADIFEPEYHTPLTVERFRQIKDWGFNVVATEAWWGLHIEPYKDQHGVYSEENLVKLEDVVRNAGEAALYVIIRLRVQHEVANPVNWDGWATHDYLLTTEGLERYCNMLEMIVQRFDHYSQVIGYNPWHFPWHDDWNPPQEKRDVYYNTITPAMINAIRRNSNKIIFYSPFHHGLRKMSESYPWVWDTGEFNYITPVNDPLSNVVYMHEGHRPLPVEWPDWEKNSYDYPDWSGDLEFLRSQMSYAKTFSDTYSVPMMLAEFGLHIHLGAEASVRPIRQSRLDCLDAKLGVLDDFGDWNWIYWLYANDELVDGVLESDLSPSDVVLVLQKHA